MTDTENTIAPELLNDERALRLSKREDYIARGVNPYPEHSEVTDYVRDIVAKYADLATGEDTEDVVKIGGRIVAKRGQGKIMFLVVRDTTADIQLFCRICKFCNQSVVSSKDRIHITKSRTEYRTSGFKPSWLIETAHISRTSACITDDQHSAKFI